MTLGAVSPSLRFLEREGTMSGGHWGYAGARLDYTLTEIAHDPAVGERWPQVAALLTSLGTTLRALEHEMDWDLSADTHIEDDSEWDARACKLLREAVTRVVTGTIDEGGEA